MTSEVNAQSVIRELGLEDFLAFYKSWNTSSKLPYHNDYHVFCMVWNCYLGAMYEQCSLAETRALILAALFHDFDHSGGRETDDLNVTRAELRFIDAVTTTGKLRMQSGQRENLSGEEIALARSAIQITKYPYDRDPVTIVERIIRDADLMQPYEPDRELLRRCYRGLQQEVELSKGMKFTDEQFASGMKAFLDSVVWHTSWATERARLLNWETKKSELVGMIERHELHDS